MVIQKDLLTQCAIYSSMAYEHALSSNNLIAQHKIDRISFSIFKEQHTFYIAFRGTANTSNWLLDFSYLKVYDKNLNVYLHKGYKKASEELFNYLSSLFLNKMFKDFEFVFTGHSMGGALAIILGLWFAQYGLDVINIITFGSPKITNKNGAKLLSENALVKNGLVRVINDKDIVNLLPPNFLIGRLKGRYQHFGEEVILLDNNTIDINPIEKVLKKNKSLFFNIDEESIEEHKIQNYIRKLNALTNDFKQENNTFKLS